MKTSPVNRLREKNTEGSLSRGIGSHVREHATSGASDLQCDRLLPNRPRGARNSDPHSHCERGVDRG
jgi:hypothetical protein